MSRRAAAIGWLRTSATTHFGVLAAGLLLAASGLSGGLDAVPLATRVGEVRPGAQIAAAPFTLTAKRAVVVDEIAGLPRPRVLANHLAVVLVDAENVGTESVPARLLSPVASKQSFQNRTLAVLDDHLLPGIATVYDADSNVVVNTINPGLTYRLALVWEFGGAVPEQLRIGVAKLTLRGLTIAPSVFEWQDPQEAATVTLPVWDKTKDPA